jgi:hypothetical protein
MFDLDVYNGVFDLAYDEVFFGVVASAPTGPFDGWTSPRLLLDYTTDELIADWTSPPLLNDWSTP